MHVANFRLGGSIGIHQWVPPMSVRASIRWGFGFGSLHPAFHFRDLRQPNWNRKWIKHTRKAPTEWQTIQGLPPLKNTSLTVFVRQNRKKKRRKTRLRHIRWEQKKGVSGGLGIGVLKWYLWMNSLRLWVCVLVGVSVRSYLRASRIRICGTAGTQRSELKVI